MPSVLRDTAITMDLVKGEKKVLTTKFEELSKLCKPIVELIQKYYDPHTHVVVSVDGVEIVQDLMRAVMNDSID